MTSTISNQAKVRVACQRCRAKRVRCDGGIPSCINCAKAAVTCIDVDARDAHKLIPRATIAQAKARIQWLETIITEHLPVIDLSLGPRVESDVFWEANNNVGKITSHEAVTTVQMPATTAPKRMHDVLEASQEEPIQAEARSVAQDLGRFSINADAREKHYLGSSSGLVFSYLAQSEGSPSSMTEVAARPIIQGQQSRPSFTAAHQALKNSLPPRDDALHLIELYICHIHPDHPVLHLQSLFKALDALYVCRDTVVELDSCGWPLDMPAFSYNGEPAKCITLSTVMFHVFMVFTLAASIRLNQAESDFAAGPFHRTARVVAPDVLNEISMTSLQAAYLMAVHALVTPVKTSIWTLSYICTAHAIDLGIHRRPEGLNSTVDVTAALVFYSVYSLDRCLASIQGRPLGIRDEAFDVYMPRIEDVLHELEQQDIAATYVLIAKDAMHYTLHKFKLDKIVSEIKTLLYFLPPQIESTSWLEDHKSHQPRLFSKLNAWHAQIDGILPQDIAYRRLRQIQLEQLYHSAVVLLFQPSQVCRHPDDDALRNCLESAMKQISCFNILYENDLSQFDWRTVRTIFAAGTTIIYTSLKIQSKDLQVEVMDALRLTTILLAVSGIWWPSVKKARASFERLVNLTHQKLQSLEGVPVRKRRQVYSQSGPSIVESGLLPDIPSSLNAEPNNVSVESVLAGRVNLQDTLNSSVMNTLVPELDSFLVENHFLDDITIDFLHSDSFMGF